VLLPVAIPPVKPTINIAVDGKMARSFYKISPLDISAILEGIVRLRESLISSQPYVTTFVCPGRVISM